MERLYTPWRMNYITGQVKDPLDKDNAVFAKESRKNDKANCVFCEMIKSLKDKDGKNFILIREKNSFMVLNLYPYNSGHLMILPNIHEGDLTRLSSQIQAELMHVTSLAVEILRDVYNPHGFNIGINMGEVAGGSISPHLHFHVVPRWQGDTNFMPIIGGTKVLPEKLEDTYKKLRAKILKK